MFADTKLPNFRFLKLEDLRESLPLIDYITPNEDEARYYTGKDRPEEMADVFLGYGVRNVIIKLGSKGCFFKNREESLSLPPCTVDAVDATGAGDNFCAGFICAFLEGRDHRECCRYANAAASICIQHDGASTGIVSRDQLQEVLDRY